MASIAVPVIGWLVSPIISKVIDHGILHFQEWWRLEEGVQEEIGRLNEVLPLIRGVLEDAEEKQSKNSGVLSWLGKLKEVLYDAEDVLDRYEVDLALMDERRDAEQQPIIAMGWKAKVRGHFSSCLCHRNVDISVAAKQIKSIRERLDDISKRGHELGLQQIATSASALENNSRVPKNRDTASFLADESTVVGRADEKETIKKMLLDDNTKKLLVVPIRGMGGVGKTTLARLVFNDKDVKAFFKSKAWVCIGMSRDLDLKRMMKEIIISVGTPQARSINYEHFTLDSLQLTLVDEIKDKQTFLMVLDDAWDTKDSSWDRLLEMLKVSGLTCRIIVTTRDQRVVNAIRSDRLETVRINLLKENDMWGIFKRRAFGSEAKDVDREMEFIGRQIVRRLEGLPLAAETIGGILHGNTDATYWRRISENKLLEVKEEENDVLPILMLSYDSLPMLLKQCFPYFSLFPKDYLFRLGGKHGMGNTDASQLSYLWMSQRLTNIEKGTTPEDTGREIILKLSNRSLLQFTERYSKPCIVIHDLLHDMAEKIAKEEFLCVNDATGNNLPKKLRHISLIKRESDTGEIAEQELKMLWDMKECRTLRTILLVNFYQKISNYMNLLDGWFNSLICLRALKLHNRYMTSLPDSIGNLKLLRYLDLSLPKLEKLPDSVSRLLNLQVMLLSGCHRLSALSNSLTALVNLVILDHKRLKTLKSIGKLTNLQQLKEFDVRRQEGHKLTELRNLNNICGSLCIRGLENVELKKEAQEAQLHKKDSLRVLVLEWDITSGQEEVQSDVLEGLCPNTNLSKLRLSKYTGTCLPSWLNREYLPFLTAIHLSECSNLKVIPTFADGLHELVIYKSPQLQEIPSLPPKLQHLRLGYVGVASLLLPSSSSSSQSPPSVHCLTSLRTLQVLGCSDLDESLSTLLKGSLPSLDSVKISGYRHPLGAFSYFTALSELILRGCSEEVGIDVRALISLKYLEIEDCPRATIKSPHPNSNPSTSLSNLTIKDSPWILKSLSQSKLFLSSLKELGIDGDTVNSDEFSRLLFGLASLEVLVMQNCPNITSVPQEALRTLVSLKSLTISSCELLDLEFLALCSLRFLRIGSCPGFVFNRLHVPSSSNQLLEDVGAIDFTAEQLAGLLSLLVHCSNVKRIDLSQCEGFPSQFPPLAFLENLNIVSCSGVTSFPALSFLQYLRIWECPDFTISELPSTPFPLLRDLWLSGMNLQQLTHLLVRLKGSPLQSIFIERCDGLMSFDGELEQSFLSLTSLRDLQISRCDHLQQLPSDLRGFKQLRRLTINGCSQMLSLPEEGLPDCLRELEMKGCPALEERYGERDGNPHRQRISGIPSITIQRGASVISFSIPSRFPAISDRGMWWRSFPYFEGDQ